jgi:DNA topoisomerase-2
VAAEIATSGGRELQTCSGGDCKLVAAEIATSGGGDCKLPAAEFATTGGGDCNIWPRRLQHLAAEIATSPPKSLWWFGKVEVKTSLVTTSVPIPVYSKCHSCYHFFAMDIVSASYRRCTPIEHIRTRPDSYVGSVVAEETLVWLIEDGKAVERTITVVPGLYKIFDEILVNAIDQTKVDPTVDSIKIEIDQAAATVSVTNTGKGIPVVEHTEYHIYIPELIFGNLLTSSNYDDSEERTTGGRNGYGAKLTNVFSKSFAVETVDLERGLKYSQVWQENMSVTKPPKITRPKNPKSGYCKITFTPDLANFSLQSLDDDFVKLLHRRAFDAAACTRPGVRVAFNGKNLSSKGSFESYCDLFIGSKKETPRVFFQPNDRWQVCLAASREGFKSISFVNGVATSGGGTHVEHVVSVLCRRVADLIQAKAKGSLVIRPAFVRERLMVFVNTTLVNPTFSSQTKEVCTLKTGLFGITCEVDDEVAAKVVSKLGITEAILAKAKEREAKSLSRTDGSKTSIIRGIPKLEDANKADGRKSADCTLLVVEGDSARAFAMSGLSVVGRDLYGVFALRGKILNCRDASVRAIAENSEIGSLKQILGLKEGYKYKSLSELRYGRVMLLTDADCDGTHIRALFLNFVEFGWPELIEVRTFGHICTLRTYTDNERFSKPFVRMKLQS